jgi:hypothetical protein
MVLIIIDGEREEEWGLFSLQHAIILAACSRPGFHEGRCAEG